MKRCWILCILFLLCMQGAAGAVEKVSGDVIAKAQQYGIVYAQKSTQDFLKPWTAYEQNAMTITDQAERAYIYTPYLLVASDARERQNSGRAITLSDSKNLLKDYGKTLIFQTVLYGTDATFANGVSASITQGSVVKNAYQKIVPDKASALSDKKQYGVKCYFYFDEKDLNLETPITLNVTKKDGSKKKFYFSLAKIQ